MDKDESYPLIKMDNRNPKNLERNISCITDSQTSALEALRANEITLFSDIINDNDDYDVNKPYPEERSKTLLQIAVESGSAEGVDILLRKDGIDVNVVNRLTQVTPLHMACIKGRDEILEKLLICGANPNCVNAEGKTPLHITAEKCGKALRNATNRNNFKKCFDKICNHQDIDIDKKDSTGLRPLAIAANYGDAEIIRKLLEKGADWSQDSGVDRTIIREIVRQKVSREHFELLKSIAENAEVNIGAVESAIRADLMKILNMNEVDDNLDNLSDFESSLKHASAEDLISKNPGEKSLIQRAAELGLARHVQALLNKGANPNLANPGTSPALILAGLNGHFEVIEVLKRHKWTNEKVDSKSKKPSNVATTNFDITDKRMEKQRGMSILHAILRKPEASEDGLLLMRNKAECEERYLRCLNVLLDRAENHKGYYNELRRIVNSLDEMKNAPLHYATQMWPQSVVRSLLEIGANIGMKNVYQEIPVENILPETMESFLNEFCLNHEGELTNRDLKMTVRYDFLAPPRTEDSSTEEAAGGVMKNRWTRNGVVDEEAKKDDLEDGDDDDDGSERLPYPETEVLWHMSQSKHHRYLLKHPVITSFLHMKWKKINSAYNKNLIFYALFTISITAFIFCLYGGLSLRITSDENGSPFYPNEVFCKENKTESDGTLRKPTTAVPVLWYMSLVLWIFLCLREFGQLSIAPRRYFFSFENWLELALIFLTAHLLILGGQDYDCYVAAKRNIAAVVIVLAWSEFITIVGRHPKFEDFNIYVTMFFKVIKTFIFFLAWYSSFILAFALGFYILLHKDTTEKITTEVEPKQQQPGGDSNNCASQNEEENYVFFDHLGLAIVKTFTMFVGELEFSDLPIESSLGYVFLLSFVFLIVVVMMNLLNGLAVSDTGVIKSEAEINYYVCQVEVISYIESMLLGDPFNFLSNWPAFVWLRRIPACSLGGALYRIPSLRKAFHRFTGASGILLFYDFLPEKKVTFYPNHEQTCCSCLRPRTSDDEAGDGSIPVHTFHPSILESAKAVSLEKMQSPDSVEERLQRTEDLMKDMKNRQRNLENLLIKLAKNFNIEN